MRIVIHCNGGPGIGVGHVVRSLALAEEAVASGHEVTFVGEYDGDFVLRALADAPVDVRPAARDDPAAVARALEGLEPDVLHLDTYDALPSSVDDLVATTRPLVSNIEDGGFGRRAADVVADPNFGAETERRDAPEPPLLLRGSRFAPLRALVTLRRGEWQLLDEATRVLVVMGGADPLNLTPRVLRVLEATRLPLHVTAISPHGPAVESFGDHLTVDLVPPVDDLPVLMAHQDLVVSAAGTSVWELCCLGVPMALVCAVENQRPGYDRVVAAGAAVGIGSTLEGEEADAAVKQLREVLENPATRQDLARQAAHVVDGLGSWRIVRAWEQLAGGPPASPPAGVALTSRRAGLADAKTLLRWRNDPDTRRASRQKDDISLDQHRAWLESSLDRDDRLLLVASDDTGDVGTVRWDRLADGEWEVSITVAPDRRGRSLARPLLLAGEEALAASRVRVSALYAGVHEGNAASRRLFVASGYLPDAPADDEGFWTYRKALVR